MRKVFRFWFPVFLWACLIFMFSSQPYEAQNLRPFLQENINLVWLTEFFSNIQIIYAGKVISVQTVGAVGFLEFCIRKGAHFSVFFILGWLLYRGLISTFQSRQLKTFMVSLTVIVLYAASDEFHQVFTENRTPLIQDVLLDIVGGFVGIYIALLRYKLKIVKHNKPTISLK